MQARKSSFRGDLWEWRYRPSLDLSPWVDSPTMTTSPDRLDAESGEQLQELGLSKKGADDRWWRPAWTDRRWRPVWTGYTPEQRRLIRVGNKPANLVAQGTGLRDGAL
jgi:hypothetical protein